MSHNLFQRCRPLLAAVMACAAISSAPDAAAQAWPSRPIHLVLPSSPGGSSDPLARVLADELAKPLDASFVIENRPGANGNTGAASVARASPDGYTLLFSWTGNLVSAVTLYHSKPFSPQADFEPIVLIGSVPNVLVVNNALPVKTMAQFVDYVRQHPGQVNYGSTGSGSSWHLAAELMKKTLHLDMVHVPYTGAGPVATDLLGGTIQASFPGSTAIASLAKEGKVRPLAVMSAKRIELLPDVPTMAELGFPQLESVTWFALLAPKGTPDAIVQKLNHAVNQLLATPSFRERIVKMGYTPMGGRPADFASYMDAEIRKWDEVVKFSGAKVD